MNTTRGMDKGADEDRVLWTILEHKDKKKSMGQYAISIGLLAGLTEFAYI